MSTAKDYGPAQQGIRTELMSDIEKQLLNLSELILKLSCHESRYMTINSAPYAHLVKVVRNHYEHNSTVSHIQSQEPKN